MAPAESKRSLLLVTNDLGPHAGGIETFILGLIDELDGEQLVIYTSKEVGAAEFDAQLTKKSGALIVRDRAKVLLPTPRITKEILKVAKKYGCEKVWFGAAAPLGLMSKKLRNNGIKRVVALTHGHEVWWAKIFPFNLALRRIGNYCDVVTYLGNFTRDSIKGAIGRRPKLQQLAPGISITHFTPGKKSLRLQNELALGVGPVIVCVGRLVRRKGQDRLIEAMPKVKEVFPNIKLLIVGEGGYKKHLLRLTRKLHLEEHINFVGRVNYQNLPEYFRLGDIFAMPSRSRLGGLEVEGLGIVYLEASACGIAVLAGDSGGAPDAVIEGETGYVISGNDSTEISTTLIKMLRDHNKLIELGAKGRAWAESYWTWEVWGQRFREILEL